MSVIMLYLIFAMLCVIWLDVTTYRIPNWLVGSLLLAYPLAVILAPHPIEWMVGLQAMGLTFVVGYIVFAMRWMGGGDVKLLIALSLWVGLTYLAEFMFLVALIGGVYSLALWLGRKLIARLPVKRELPRILREGEPIAYGLAIAAAFMWMMHIGKIAAAI